MLSRRNFLTGSAMALVGAVREQTGVLLNPAELRDALHQWMRATNGTAGPKANSAGS